jgi:hypothetical protein
MNFRAKRSNTDAAPTDATVRSIRSNESLLTLLGPTGR